MTASLKQVANCIGLSGDFSILRHFYGYITGAPQQLSLLQQVRLLQGRHIHLNLIRVGIESFTCTEEQIIDGAVQIMRDIYATVDLGVGRVERYFITTADANGRDDISDCDEAEALTEEWTVNNGALDVFFVLTHVAGGAGISPREGSCDKDAKEMNGCIVLVWSPLVTGQALAHEVGHYLGLRHSDDPSNIMFHTVPNGGHLTNRQGRRMRQHCFVYSGCPNSHRWEVRGGGLPL